MCEQAHNLVSFKPCLDGLLQLLELLESHRDLIKTGVLKGSVPILKFPFGWVP